LLLSRASGANVAQDAARTVRAGLWPAIRFPEEVTTMSSKKAEPAALPIVSDSLCYHLKPRPIEAEIKEDRKDRRSRQHCRRLPRVGADARNSSRGPVAKSGTDSKVQPNPEPIAGWITRAEARSVLGIEEDELAALIARFRLRRSLVEVYSKPEILALREIVEKLR
jgi:hypothetical protein